MMQGALRRSAGEEYHEQYHHPAHGAGRLERCVRDLFRGHRHGARHLPDHLPALHGVDAFHIKECRLVILDGGELAGWAALRRVDPRWCYRGVAEVSIYVGEKFRGRGLGSRLLTALCEESEKEGYWTLHSTVLQDNTASLGLHTKCGFRVVGRRERIARDCHGRWLDTYLMERRAKADEPAGYKKL